MKADFSFTYGPRLVSGTGSANRLSDLLPEGPVLFVTDAVIVELGLADDALAALVSSGRRVTIASEVEADPSRATLEAVVALGRQSGAASVVGFGGGSPMDVAKLAAYLIGSGDDLDTIWGVGNAKAKGLPLLLVPTTAGTGSEATPISIITLPGDEKRGVSSAALVAGHAVLDPALTLGLPRPVTAATGMDAMVHAIEAYTSVHLKNPLSDMLAREALRLLAANLLLACEEPGNMNAREAMLLGSHIAGVAFSNAPVAGVHALAYPLGGRFHVPHGLSNVLMLPHVLRFNMSAAMPLYAELGPLVNPELEGLGQQAQAQGLLEGLVEMAAKAGMPARLSAVGVSANDLDQLATDAMMQDRLLRNNPRNITLDDARQLYEAAL